ncbi:Leucine carboxyl methyltransferase domain-containing protein [Phytophthora infestans]|uniref:Leucine carboxyl methyltransferase domain-containing protein n=2 Tax=Phytophthora infestans TaxID=4787 RepID=A0A833SUG0_PHYIN|nr:Leucine carboxyl methyltransferase domain-containing protein [Phytophthora infestans]
MALVSRLGRIASVVTHFSSCLRLRIAIPMERTANTPTFVLEPIDAPPSSPTSSKMQGEDFAQFTSFVDACLRAIEDAREDRLIHDPFAEPLTREVAPQLTPRLKKWQEKQPYPENYIAVRGRYLDDAIAQRNPNIRQVVFLGAGLDTRVFRLESLHGCHVLELDQSAELFEHKRAILKDLGPKLLVDRHDYVVADLNAFNWEEGLLSSGFNPDLPTFWVLEGIMVYLNQASNLALLKTIDVLSAPGSEVWGDMAGRGLLVDDGLSLFKDVNDLYRKELGEQLFKHAEDDVYEGVFSELPWEMEVQAALVEPGTHFGREWAPAFTRSEMLPVTFNFVLARKPLADLP